MDGPLWVVGVQVRGEGNPESESRSGAAQQKKPALSWGRGPVSGSPCCSFGSPSTSLHDAARPLRPVGKNAHATNHSAGDAAGADHSMSNAESKVNVITGQKKSRATAPPRVAF
jgi:hypothetical protein